MLDYSKVPGHPRMAEGVRCWIEDGKVGAGSFIEAMVTNDFQRACLKADDMNRELLVEWAQWWQWEAPGNCWGSPETATAWADMHEKRRAGVTT